MSTVPSDEPEAEDTPPTRSYVDALLKGNMTPSQIASLRTEIAHEPDESDLRAPPPPHFSTMPPRPPSSAPPRAAARPTSRPAPDPDEARTLVGSYRPEPPPSSAGGGRARVRARPQATGLRPPEPTPQDDDDVRTVYRTYVSSTPGVEEQAHEAAAVPPPPPSSRAIVELDLGDDDDDARTMMRLPGPYNSPSQRPQAAVVESLDDTYLRALGGLAGVPRVAVSPAQLTQHPLGCQAAFVVSRVDGDSTVEDLIDVSGLTRLETLRLLYELVHEGIVSIARAASAR